MTSVFDFYEPDTNRLDVIQLSESTLRLGQSGNHQWQDSWQKHQRYWQHSFMRSKIIVADAARCGRLLTILKRFINENPVCSPQMHGEGNPAFLREWVILVINFNENRDLEPASFDNIDLSERGTHSHVIQGVRDPSRYLATLPFRTIGLVLPGRASHFYPNESTTYQDKFDSVAAVLTAELAKSGHPVINPEATYSNVTLQVKND